MEQVTRIARLVAVTLVGGALVVGGIVLLPLPGPGSLLIVAGLVVLSLEYHWARRLRDEATERIRRIRVRREANKHAPSPSAIVPDSPPNPSEGGFHNVA
jgi:uncharacterized protein (TIGR02611 family)